MESPGGKPKPSVGRGPGGRFVKLQRDSYPPMPNPIPPPPKSPTSPQTEDDQSATAYIPIVYGTAREYLTEKHSLKEVPGKKFWPVTIGMFVLLAVSMYWMFRADEQFQREIAQARTTIAAHAKAEAVLQDRNSYLQGVIDALKATVDSQKVEIKALEGKVEKYRPSWVFIQKYHDRLRLVGKDAPKPAASR